VKSGFVPGYAPDHGRDFVPNHDPNFVPNLVLNYDRDAHDGGGRASLPGYPADRCRLSFREARRHGFRSLKERRK
jgi:hypothetical protein